MRVLNFYALTENGRLYVNQTNRYDVRENLIEQAYFDKNAKP